MFANALLSDEPETVTLLAVGKVEFTPKANTIVTASRSRGAMGLIMSAVVPTRRALMRIIYMPLEYAHAIPASLWVTIHHVSNCCWHIIDHLGHEIPMVNESSVQQHHTNYKLLMRGILDFRFYYPNRPGLTDTGFFPLRKKARELMRRGGRDDYSSLFADV